MQPPTNSRPVSRRRDLVEAGAVLLQRRQALVRLREHRRDVLEDVLHPLDVDRDDVAALRDRDHERLGLLRDALGGAVAGPGLHREDRRVGHQLDVRPADLLGARVEHDRTVHLRHLVEQRRRVVDVELDPAAEQERDLLGLGDQDQPAGARVDDAVDPLAQRRAGRDHVECPQQSGIETGLKLVQLIPVVRHHRGAMMAKTPAPRAPAESRVDRSDCALSSRARAARPPGPAGLRPPRRALAPRRAGAGRLAGRRRSVGCGLSPSIRSPAAGARTGPRPNLSASATRRSGWATKRSSPVSPTSPKQASGLPPRPRAAPRDGPRPAPAPPPGRRPARPPAPRRRR